MHLRYEVHADARHREGLLRLVPWLLASAVLHGAFIQWVGNDGRGACCGMGNESLSVSAASTGLSVRLDGRVGAKTVPRRETSGFNAAARKESEPGSGGLIHHYFPARELDRKPEPGVDIGFAGQEALAEAVPGNVVLELFINETGSMDNVRIESATLPAGFQNLAREALLKAVFSPGYKDGMPVKSRLRIEVTVEDVAPGILYRSGIGPAPAAG